MTLSETIDHLVSLGEYSSDTSLHSLSSLKLNRAINLKTLEWWESHIDGISTKSLINLQKGLTIAVKELRWGGGSVASGISLFSMFLDRNPPVELVDETAAWIIKNTSNAYVPFGTMVTLGAKNYTEFAKLSQRRDALIQEELSRDCEFEKNAKALRDKRNQLRSKCAQLRDDPERIKLIEKLNGMSIKAQLEHISKDDAHAVNYYPTRCANLADLTVIESLSEETKATLAKKMIGKHRGPWGAFKKRLLSVTGPVGLKTPWDLNVHDRSFE